MGEPKTCDHIQIKIKMPNPSQEPPAPNNSPNQDLKDMDVLCMFKIKIESQNLDHGCIKDQWPYPNKDQNTKPQSGASSIIQSPKSGLKILQLIHLPEPYFVHNWLVQSEQNSNSWLNLRQKLKLNQDKTLPDLIFSQVWAILEGWKDEEMSSYVKNPQHHPKLQFKI